MKALIVILTFILAQQVSANNSCFNNSAVQDLIKASTKLDKCFKDGNICDYENRPLEQQKEINARRLAPIDRSKIPLFNVGVGRVKAEFNFSDEAFGATAEKISRCHIITSAHLVYEDVNFNTSESEFNLDFQSEQTCTSSKPFNKSAIGDVVFKMTDENRGDFECVGKYGFKDGTCAIRRFHPHSDLMIIKLKKGSYDENDRNFFTLNTQDPKKHASKTRVNCWGFPGEKDSAFLWFQRGALISNEDTGKGILTNAVAYKGMSGGGCSSEENPRELLGLFSSRNRTMSQAAISLDANGAIEQSPNILSGFHRLSARFSEMHQGRKTLADLDKDCK